MIQKHLETIFDHGITPEELTKILPDDLRLSNKTSYLEAMEGNDSWMFLHIGQLYELRGNLDKAKRYMELSDFPVGEIIDHCY